MSGLRINYDKLALVPILCEEDWVIEMKRALGCVVVSLPTQYLGIPLGANPKWLEA